jgi:hypothetical protein
VLNTFSLAYQSLWEIVMEIGPDIIVVMGMPHHVGSKFPHRHTADEWQV